MPPYGGETLLVDTSAWIEVRKAATPPEAKRCFVQAHLNGQFRSSPVVAIELYKGARDASEVAQVDSRVRRRELPLSEAIGTLAIDAMRELALEFNDVNHSKIPIGDVFIAATAAAYRIGVLTADRTDFRILARVPLLDQMGRIVHPVDDL